MCLLAYRNYMCARLQQMSSLGNDKMIHENSQIYTSYVVPRNGGQI